VKSIDRRLQSLFLVTATLACLGVFLEWLPSRGVEDSTPPAAAPVESEARARSDHADLPQHERELARLFQSAVVMLHARRYEYALVALDRVLLLAPEMPEAHVNRGFALLGAQRPELAAEAFTRAIDLRRDQTNAYYGLGVAHEEMGDRPSALGAMRAFVHLAAPDDPFVRKARAALWEWQNAGSADPSSQHVTPPLASGPTASLAAAAPNESREE